MEVTPPPSLGTRFAKKRGKELPGHHILRTPSLSLSPVHTGAPGPSARVLGPVPQNLRGLFMEKPLVWEQQGEERSGREGLWGEGWRGVCMCDCEGREGVEEVLSWPTGPL